MQKKITFRCAFLSSQADIFASLKQCHFLFEIQNNFYLMLKCSHTFINVLTDFFFLCAMSAENSRSLSKLVMHLFRKWSKIKTAEKGWKWNFTTDPVITFHRPVSINSYFLTPVFFAVSQAPWTHATAAALKNARRRASRALRWWWWTVSPRWTRLCWWTASSACRRPWLASRRKSSSWRITSSSWWRRSAGRPSEWEPERLQRFCLQLQDIKCGQFLDATHRFGFGIFCRVGAVLLMQLQRQRWLLPLPVHQQLQLTFTTRRVYDFFTICSSSSLRRRPCVALLFVINCTDAWWKGLSSVLIRSDLAVRINLPSHKHHHHCWYELSLDVTSEPAVHCEYETWSPAAAVI